MGGGLAVGTISIEVKAKELELGGAEKLTHIKFNSTRVINSRPGMNHLMTCLFLMAELIWPQIRVDLI